MMEFEELPRFLVDLLDKQYGNEISRQIMEGFGVNRFATLRVNTLKSDVNTVQNELEKAGIRYEMVPWCEEALILKNAQEKEIQLLEIYEKGEIYLQSLSSMLPPIVLDPKPDTDILDMAAAPGGKTTQMAAMTQNKAHITACEMNHIRSERLRYNLEKQGAKAHVMVTDSRKIDDFFSFDSILLDSPCSGSGTLNRKELDLEKKFTMKLIQKSVSSQLALLKKAMAILKPGHEMVYSTCSILACENEEIVKQILKEGKAEIVPITLKGMESLPILPTQIKGTLCICPNELFEGFFVAKIRKK